MPDKIANHFVLANGSTAKYSADGLTDDIFARKNIINRFNKETISSGHYLDIANGNLVANANFYASDFIYIKDLDNVKCCYTHIVCFYDELRNFISGQGFNAITADGSIEKPVNAVYMRFSAFNNSLDIAQIGKDVTRDVYVLYGKYTLPNFENETSNIIVNVNGGGDYTSFTRALYETVDSGTPIVVKPGTYDIKTEYIDIFGQTAVDNMADTDNDTFNGFQYGVIIRNRKVTFETGAKLVCDWAGHTVNGTHRFSPLRVDYDTEIDGLNMNCNNTFYAIHDDYGLLNTPYTNKYKNCVINADSLRQQNVIGGGTKKFSRHIIENCYFNATNSNIHTVRYHNTNQADAVPEIFVSNTFFNGTFTARWYGTQTTKMKVYVNNCEARAIYTMQEATGYDEENVEMYKWNNKETDPVS